ncbi:hypothetical protein, partial [Rosenbergiella nectarea]
MAREIDSNIANRILSSIQFKYNDFDPRHDKVSFVGKLDVYNPWAKKNSDTFGVSMFSFSNGDPNRMSKFISLTSGISLNLHIASEEQKIS